MEFKVNIKEYEDKSITINEIYLPNGNIIVNTRQDVDLSPMNEFIGQEFIMNYNNNPRYKCVLRGNDKTEEGVSRFNYDIVENINQ